MHQNSRSRYAWTFNDCLIIAASSVIFGLIYWLWGLPYTWLLVDKGVNPAIASLINGMWFMGGFIPAAIIRKPGVMAAGQALAALVEVTILPYAIDIGGGFGPEIYTNVWLEGQAIRVFNVVFMVGLIEGLGPELVFGWLGYRNWSLKAFWLAGAAGAVMEWCSGIWMTHYYLLYPRPTFWAILFTSVIAISFIAGTIAWYIGEVYWRRKEKTIYPAAEVSAAKEKRPMGISPGNRWSSRDVLILLGMSLVFGLVYSLAFTRIGAGIYGWAGQPWTALSYGLWMVAGFVGIAVFRKPGAFLFTEALTALVAAFIQSCPLCNDHQLWAQIELKDTVVTAFQPVFFIGVLQGLGGEVVFCVSRYIRWNYPIWALSSAGCAFLSWLGGIYVTKGYVTLPRVDFYLVLLLSAVGIALTAGVVGWLLSRKLYRN